MEPTVETPSAFQMVYILMAWPTGMQGARRRIPPHFLCAPQTLALPGKEACGSFLQLGFQMPNTEHI